MKRKVTVALIMGLLLLSFCSVAYAAPDIDLIDLPQNVADYFGIPLFAAELLVSAGILLFATVLVGFVMKRSANQAILYSILIVDFVLMGFLVALSWLDYWIFLIVCLLVAIMFAGTLRDLITGK